MKITQSQKSQKFTISNLTMDQLILIHNSIDDAKIERVIYQALLESLDEETLSEEFGIDPHQYLVNAGLVQR